MVRHLGILHAQIAEAMPSCTQPSAALHQLLLLTLRYFHQHQGLIKLFLMQIGYGDSTATEQLRGARQTYRSLLSKIIEDGIAQGVFLSADVLDRLIAINSIIGTINWSLYELLVVKSETFDPEALSERLTSHLLRSLMR